MSTPSNNIRRLQRQQLAQPDLQQYQQSSNRPAQHPKKKEISHKSSKNGRLIKTKLLNLHQSQKRSIDKAYGDSGDGEGDNGIYDVEVDPSHPNQSVPSFILHKPINMNSYDYSVFTNYPDGTDLQHGEHLPPAVKESQIKAWESAEKISRNVIFGDASDSDDGESDVDHNPESAPYVTYLPGYSREEWSVILSVYNELQARLGGSLASMALEEKNQLHELKKKIQANHERLLSQTHAISTRRQVQITQKKELLNKMFGYANNLNREYITNNSLYSALDNSSNIQKTFHEDKEEVSSLLAEDSAYTAALMETAQRLAESSASGIPANDDDEAFDYDTYHRVVSQKLDEIYDAHLEVERFHPDHAASNGELQQFATAYLRRCLHNDSDEVATTAP
ncbi:uncharacterized protein CANTADRAFT_91088 [Suhomyces tanzawaensis NRRL Y-17324]|uniref:Uncharacterized protein n=1 Tax=Suhomyces tanzawaensis NRRL Y-17324 TaxID=984487 RepID=A0A1E4SHA5_9ASCO|nr:uncharacterized protein CANTADRAFT_91088 [Suhomyces tanzawaensis NRRL Y-17324]ODV78802.1 hypothetical protein CANTADRAFT_91088 [Suhomyces tanzawaensis NRRL Y-17324]